jgi:ADP-ribose pyrophosphatase YjhB (NUDIX family)
MIDLTHWVPRRSVDDGDRPKLRPFAIVDRHGGAITQHGETTADALIRFLSEGITVDLDAVRHLAVRHDESIRLWRRSRPRSDFFLTVPAGVGSIDEPEWWCADMDDRQLDRFQD